MKPNVSVKSSLEQRKDKNAKTKKKRRREKKRLLMQSEKAFKKSLVKQIIDSDSATYTDTRLKRPSHVQSSDEVSSSSTSSESTVNKTESMDRKINVQDGSVSVTFPRACRKVRRRPKKRSRNENSSETSPIIIVKRNIYNPMVISDTKVRAGKKMTQRKKENKQQPALVKSNCGTFTVDGVTASSQSSDSEVVSLEEQSTPNYYLHDLDRIRQHVKSGRNKLSNMFSQHNLSKNVRNVGESGQENVTKKRKRSKVKKLPTEILDTLSSEEDNVPSKRQRSTDSDQADNVPMKKKRRNRRKTRVKSGVSGESYVPCVTGGATQFGLSRLDKTAVHTLQAAQFRTDQLYGASVKRITIMDFTG
uniref:Uncharacterized protein n=1 Tax=Cuerna arida TaxID=1464854 RepID=A0A1B6GF52_9HEMI